MFTKARSLGFAFVLSIVSIVLGGEGTAGAQPSGVHDVVRLRSGGILRGTIAEVVPGRGVVILLLTGEVRRVPASEIVFAGPESGSQGVLGPRAAPGSPGVAPVGLRGAGLPAPARSAAPTASGPAVLLARPSGPAPLPMPMVAPRVDSMVPASYGAGARGLPPIVSPAPTAPPRAFDLQAPIVSVRFEAEEPGTTLHRVIGTSVASATVFVGGRVGHGVSTSNSYERVCTAPCTFAAPLGTHDLALSVPGRTPIPADPVTFARGGLLRGEYDSRAGIRAVGWTIFIAGIAGGLALLGAGFQVGEDEGGITESSRGRAMIYGSLAVLAGAPLLSLPFVLQRDSAELETR